MPFKRTDFLETLNGLVCLYKPPDVGSRYLVSSFANKVCSDLNSLDKEAPANYLVVRSNPDSVSVNIRPSYLANRLATGPRYEREDFTLFPSLIGFRTSGVCGINSGTNYVRELKKCTPIKVFHVKGKLGEATRFLYKDEKVVARAKYSSVSRETLDKILCRFQAAHQRQIFVECGLNIKSQAAYELAVKGMLKPIRSHVPAIYSVKCIDFQSPEFILEIICIQETENYLLKFIHDLGLELRTLAHCTGMRCVRYGPFTVHNSLLLKECTLGNIKKNMKVCKQLMQICRENKSLYLKLASEDGSSSQIYQEIGKSSVS